MISQRTRLILLTLSAIIPFFIYLLTVAPTVVFFDSGELITSSFLVSPAHPPGYPLYVMMGKFATFLPFGSVAYKVNIMAAFFSSLAVMTVFLITSQVIKDLQVSETLRRYQELISFATAITFAFSYSLWNQAIIAEVYPLNTFITGLLIYILLSWRDKAQEIKKMRRWEDGNLSTSQPLNFSTSQLNDSRLLYLVCFLFGLGLGNHHTLLVILPIIFLVVAVTNWRLLFDAKAWSISLAFFMLGLSVYIFLPLRALQNPELNWGDPDTISKLKWVIFREGYPKGELSRPWGLFWQQAKTFDIIYEFSGAGLLMGCLGIIAYIIKKPMEVLITVSVILILSLGIIIYGNPIPENVFLIESFHTPSYMIFSVWIGAGMFFLLSLIYRFAGKVFESKVMTAVLAVLIILLPTSLCAYFYPWNDRSDDFIAYDYAQNELATMPSNSVLFTWGDSGAFPLWYAQMVERFQPSVLLIHTPHLSTKWYIDELPDSVRLGQLQWIQKDDLYAEAVFMIMLRENYGNYPLYIDYSTRYSVPVEGYASIPQGLVYELSTDSMKMTDINMWGKYAMRGIYKKDPYRDLDTGKAVSIYANTLFDVGNHLLRLGYSDEAYTQFGEAAKISPGLKQQVREIMFGQPEKPEGKPEGHP
ncbi:MAG: DUF2723 domain-containing protein [Deltaproteobacteria bacterium]|nr:DUF2723 domain-containing protein [Deltaproteobacteria bacterium]